MNRLATIWAIFQGLLLEALPFLLIGVLIAGIARWIAPGGSWLQRLPSRPLLAPLSGAALGFALPACECGNVPVARRLLAGGAPLGSALAAGGTPAGSPAAGPGLFGPAGGAAPEEEAQAVLITVEDLQLRRLAQPVRQALWLPPG